MVAEESSERTYALSKCATLCACSMQPPHLYARAPGLPFLALSVYLLQSSSPLPSPSPSRSARSPGLAVFRSLSVAYSECCPRTVKWTIFDCTALGLDDDDDDEEEEAARSFQGRERF